MYYFAPGFIVSVHVDFHIKIITDLEQLEHFLTPAFCAENPFSDLNSNCLKGKSPQSSA